MLKASRKSSPGAGSILDRACSLMGKGGKMDQCQICSCRDNGHVNRESRADTDDGFVSRESRAGADDGFVSREDSRADANDNFVKGPMARCRW